MNDGSRRAPLSERFDMFGKLDNPYGRTRTRTSAQAATGVQYCF